MVNIKERASSGARDECQARPRKLVGSIVQAAAVLRHLGVEKTGSRGVTAIAAALGIGPSSCFNVLKTLVFEGLVEFDRTDKTYRLGIGLLEIARRSLSNDPVVAASVDGLAALAERFDAAAGLWKIGTQRSILVALADSPAAIRLHMAIGQRQPLLAGAVGRAVAAVCGVPDEEIARGYQALRWQEAPGPEVYLEQVAAGRRNGWTVDRDQNLRGITTIAVTLPLARGQEEVVNHVLSVSIFSGRHPEAVLPEIGTALRELAEAISRRLH